MGEVFLCEKGQLTDPSKAALRKAGVVVVEVADPSKCQFIRSSEVVNSDDMVWALLDAICRTDRFGSSGKEQREALAQNLFSIVAKARGLEPTSAPKQGGGEQ